MEQLLVKNPANSTATVTTYPCYSPVLLAMGRMGEFAVVGIEYPASPSARSPWSLTNSSWLSKRADAQTDCSKVMLQEILAIGRLEYFTIPMSAMVRCMEIDRLIAMYSPRTLAETLSNRYDAQLGPLEVYKANKVVMVLLNTLDYLHQTARIIHGDISAHNICVDEACDFVELSGYSASRRSTIEGILDNNTRLGPLSLSMSSAPEVLEHGVVTTKSDIFSLGLVVFSMLSCMPPHTFPGMDETAVPDSETIGARYKNHKERKLGEPRLKRVTPCLHVLGKPTPDAAGENRLNYRCLGTRPPIPNIAALGASYADLLAIFYICTKRGPKSRPSASQLLTALGHE